MSEPLILKSMSPDGFPIEAAFMPGEGLNLIRFKKGSIETIAPQENEHPGFLLGPHFGKKRDYSTPQEPGKSTPYWSGVGRYAPWKIEQTTDTQFTAQLTGKDSWRETPLAQLEGQSFQMTCKVKLKDATLSVEVTVVSDTDSIAGVLCPFQLPEGTGRISSEVKKEYYEKGILKNASFPGNYDASQGKLSIDLPQPLNHAFHPLKNPLEGKVLLETPTYHLLMNTQCKCQENAWIVQTSPSTSSVSLGMISAKNPWRPHLTVSALQVEFTILYTSGLKN